MSDQEEIWKPVVGWEGLYEVSTAGRVRSLDRLVKGYKGSGIRRGKILSRRFTTGGYSTVLLQRYGKKAFARVSRLVADAFIGSVVGMEVDHINRDRKDDSVGNLRLATKAQNCTNRIKPNQSGITGAHWNAKQQQWTSSIVANGKRKYLGAFESPEAAGAAYRVAAREMHGEFHAPEKR